MSVSRLVPRILVVDDDSEMLGFLSEQLSSRKFLVRTALSGGEALSLAQEYLPDLLICDLKMPLIDGIACMEAFQRIDPSLHVIMISGEATVDRAVGAMKKGAFDFLLKPIVMQELLLCIEKALLKKHLEAAVQVYGRTCRLLDASHSDDLFGHVAPLLSRYLSADQCAAFLIDESGSWRTVSVFGLEDGSVLTSIENFTKNFCAMKEKRLTPSFLPSNGAQIRPALFVPLVHQERFLGALCLCRTTVRKNFTPTDVRETEIFATRITQALESLRTAKILGKKMTELRQAYETLGSSKDLLGQREKLAQLGTVIATIAHEINNPLAAILGYADLILQSKSVDAEIHDQLSVVYNEAARCKTMLGEILMYSRQRKPRFVRLRVREVVENALQIMHPELLQFHAQVTLGGPAMEAEILADADLLKQVFLNLIKNALQAMSGQTEKRLEIELASVGDFIHIAMRDHGTGIPVDLLKKIFDPYFTTKGADEGSGLGLAVASEIVREHCGRLTAVNAPDGGTVFRIELPKANNHQLEPLDHAA